MEKLNNPYNHEVADLCRLQQSILDRMDQHLIHFRLKDIRLSRKFNKYKRTTENFILFLRRY